MTNTPKEKTVPIDSFLKKKVLERLNKKEGIVEISEEQWDMGMCDTCSFPENGFAVYVDRKLVWPSKDYLNNFGGYIYADDKGHIQKGKLSSWGYFFAWLDNEDLAKLAQQEH